MTHLQTDAPCSISSNRPYLCTNKPGRVRDETASNLIINALSRYDISGLHHASNAMNDAIRIRDIENKRPFPIQSSPRNAHILVAGWGFRSQVLRNGTRQITDVIAPGDFCLIGDLGPETSSYVEACGPARVAVLDTGSMSDASRGLIEHARRAQQGEVLSRLRSRLVSRGRRDARQRLSYLVAETHARLAAVDLTEHSTFDWPFTQEQLGDILGLTPVHINRVLGRLRDEGLLVVRNRQIVILDLPGLRRVGEFDSL